MSRKIDNVLRWLETSAEKYPDKTAFADETHDITYSRLVQKAKCLATAISARVPPRSPIAVLGNKTVDTVVAFFSCVYAGCFYVPLNPSHPEDRLERILAKLSNPLVLVTDGVFGALPGCAENIMRTDEATDVDYERLSGIAERHIDVDPLYVIFTSGSTGEPKGIAVSHRSVIDFIEEFTDLFSIGSDEVIGNQAPFDFDVSVKDIYSTVRAGATMQIIPKAKFSFPVMLIDYMIERRITALIWAASALCIISDFRALSYKTPPDVKKILFSGEAMPIKQLNYWKKHYPDAMFVNLYGPTEITCNCTYYVVGDGEFEGQSLPIGKPFPNERIFLMADDGSVVERPGEPGEICVVGTALSLGYYGDAQETERAFVTDPRITAYPQKAYRTGDVGYIDGDGLLYFAGRRDFQIKHMGHRIELGEIDAAACDAAGVSRAVSVFDAERKRLYLYYTGDADAGETAAFLRKRLPAYMQPQRFIKIDVFPLTENGKVDRARLLLSSEDKERE